jgi:RNA polymerase sigma-70 factor (ECF subfamily)
MEDLAAILSAAEAGNRDAWKALVDAQAGRIYAIAWAATGDHHAAEDVVQEVFLQICCGRLRRIHRGNAAAFLGLAAARAAIDSVRRRKARRRREEAFAMTREAKDAGPHERIVSEEEGVLLRHAFDLLPLDTRTAIWFHVVEGESIRVVAGLLGRPHATVSDWIRGGLSRLRERLGTKTIAIAAPLAWPEILRGLSPRPSPILLQRLEALGSAIEGGRAAVLGTIRIGGLILSGNKVVAGGIVAILLILLSLGVLYLGRSDKADRPKARQPSEVARNQTLSTSLPRPSVNGLPETKASPAGNAPTAAEVGMVTGYVLDEITSAPIQGATIEPLPEAGDSLPGGERRVASTGPEGRFELTLSTSFAGRLRASAPDHVSTNFQPATGVVVLLGRKLPVSGWIVDLEDRPIEGAEIGVTSLLIPGGGTRYLSEPHEAIGASGPEGEFTIVPMEFGQLHLSVWKRGYGGIVAKGISPGASGAVIRVPPGATVSGRVVGSAGPVAGEDVHWDVSAGMSAVWSDQVVTDDRGEFEIRGVPAPGKVRIYLERLIKIMSPEEERRAWMKEIPIEPGDVVGDVNIDTRSADGRLGAEPRPAAEFESKFQSTAIVDREPGERKVFVRGDIHDLKGRPVGLALVQVRLVKDNRITDGRAVSDADGKFEVECILRDMGNSRAAGTYPVLVFVHHPLYGPVKIEAENIVLPEEPADPGAPVEVDPLSIAIVPGYTLSGRVIDRQGRPVEGVRVIVMDEDYPSDPSISNGGSLLCYTDGDGSFALRNRRSGEKVKLFLFHPDHVTLSIPLTSQGDTGRNVDLGYLRLDDGGTLKGILLGNDGQHLSYWYVSVNGLMFQPPAMTDALGQFTLEHVPVGKQRIVVLSMRDNEEPLSVEDPASVFMSEGGELEVQIKVKGRK